MKGHIHSPRDSHFLSDRAPAFGFLTGSIFIVAGSALPWAYYGTSPKERLYGLLVDGPLLGRIFDHPVMVKDGWLVLLLGLILGVLAGRAIAAGGLPILPTLAVVTLTALLTIFEIAEFVSESGVPPYFTQEHDSVGPGLFVLGLGAAISLIALVGFTLRPRTASR